MVSLFNLSQNPFYKNEIKLQMQKNFMNSVKMTAPSKNLFDLTHDVKFSGQMGNLMPICCIPTIPGDKFTIGNETLVRLAPLVNPVMHRLDVTVHYFFVPKRIVWPNWENYVTNTEVAGNLPVHPYFDLSSGNHFGEGTLADYLGIPPAIGAETERISAIPFACYQKIYNEYYRDQNLIDEAPDTLGDGANSFSDFRSIRRRCWEHDYFTSCLPFAQKGDPVELPLGAVQLKDNWDITDTPRWEEEGGVDAAAGNIIATAVPSIESSGAGAQKIAYDPDGSLVVGATTINDLRTAFRLQEWLEKQARGGSRYIESMLVHFGVRSSDARLQRPEYIGGVKQAIQISEVLNTTGTTELPQGNMSGHGVGVIQGSDTSRFYCEEHGYIIGILSVMPKTSYQQGIARHWLMINDPFELPWPSFYNLGEQGVLNKEVYAFQGATGNEVFGYSPRYSEYRFESNRVAGDFRSSLDSWTITRQFATPPELNYEFVLCEPRQDIFAVTDSAVDKLYICSLNKIMVSRKLTKYGTPTF